MTATARFREDFRAQFQACFCTGPRQTARGLCACAQLRRQLLLKLPRCLFVSKRDDRVEARSLPCRIETEEHTNCACKDHGEQHR